MSATFPTYSFSICHFKFALLKPLGIKEPLWQLSELVFYLVGCHGSVVACATYIREIAGLIPGCAEYVPTLCS